MGDNNKTQLGKILLKQKLVDPSDLDSLLQEQKIDHERLASKALGKGLIDEIKALKALSEQHGVPATNLDEVEIVLKNLDVIPQDIALKHLILPVAIAADTIYLAMANPNDRRVIDEIEFVTGKRVFPHVALHSQLGGIIDKCYKAHDAGQEFYRGKLFGIAKNRADAAMVKPAEPNPAGTVIPDSVAGTDIDFSVDVDIPIEEASVAEAVPEEPELMEPLATLTEPEMAPADPAAVAPVLPQPSEPTGKKSARKSGARKILVVDDEDDIRLLISRVLTDKGYTVVAAARGLEAIQKVQSEKPDMLVLDAMLPEVHGFDICKKIKGSSKYGHIPVIMISAIYRGWRYAQDLKDSYGVDDFIEKPFKINELLEKVEKYSRVSTEVESRSEDLSKEAERTLSAGIKAYRAGKLDEAVDLLKKGVGIDPLAFKLHYHLALLLGKKGLSYQAIRSLENALELAPDYFPALKNLAVLYQKAGFKFKAIETWERALGYCTDEEMREGIKRHLVSLL
ncbi:MAG: response regulator [Deltaproteobacteria bacterium]|nr:response regulator [Deltaproteobacteria bacterium]